MDELVLNKRLNTTAHAAKKERKKGFVPGVIYGKKVESMMFEIGEMDLVKELSSTGEHGVVDFNLDGYNGRAVIKDLQKDSITHKVMHIDLEEVYGDNDIITEVPIKYNGKDFLSKKGVVLQTQKDCVKVSCKAENLPKYINFDVSNAKVGSVYKLSDMEIGSEISVLDDLSTVCASVAREQFIPTGDEETDLEEE